MAQRVCNLPEKVANSECEPRFLLASESVIVSSGGMHVRIPPELYQQCHAFIGVDQGICGFYSHQLLTVPWTTRRSSQSIRKRSALGFLWKE